MEKLLLGLSFLALGILLVFGLHAPDNPIMWLASVSGVFELLRIILMTSLLYLLVFGSPHNVRLRTLIGLGAAGLGAYALGATYLSDIKFEDSLALLMVSVSLSIAVLESQPEPESEVYALPAKPAKAVPVTKGRLATSH
jgi:hypothetical protein